MGYLVLARKYRPQTFAQMAGQEHVVRTLSNALARGQLAHAFLFTGPRGVGKTTAARLVAKAVNCVHGPTSEPCGRCPACLEIAEGRSVDVVEIDAASNNGVDNVRDIVEAVKYRPARDRHKVFVVDEVHMLSQGAFNALLKTLEEPPPHVVFVLATTDVHRVPETILSRCQRFDFRRLSLAQIVEQLRAVARAEGMSLSDPALALLARAAEGGMRDALSLLDRVRAAAGDTPDDAAVAEAVGAVDAAAVSRIGWALIRRDGAALLAEVASLHERGQEMRRVAEEVVRHLRDVTVTRLAPAVPLDLPDAERKEVEAQAAAASPSQLARLFDVAQRAVADARLSDQPRYALEVALLKGALLAPGVEVAELIARVEALAGGAVAAGPAPGGGEASRLAPGPAAPPARATAPPPAPDAAPGKPRRLGPRRHPATPRPCRWRSAGTAPWPRWSGSARRWCRTSSRGPCSPCGRARWSSSSRRTAASRRRWSAGAARWREPSPASSGGPPGWCSAPARPCRARPRRPRPLSPRRSRPSGRRGAPGFARRPSTTRTSRTRRRRSRPKSPGSRRSSAAMPVADPIARLVKELSRLPGIGEKTAQRLAFHILEAGPAYAEALASAVSGVVRDVRTCSACQTLTEQDPCAICRDPRRDGRLVCVVEGVPDLIAIERTHEYRGRYHVLHGALSPLDGVGPGDLKIRELLLRLERQPAEEVIVATNPDVEGEATALYLVKLLRPLGVKLSRIAQGVPMGGDLEYADQVTLARALAGRREI